MYEQKIQAVMPAISTWRFAFLWTVVVLIESLESNKLSFRDSDVMSSGEEKIIMQIISFQC